ncbi:hypothetical protein [Nostoc sp. ChiQUE01b]|nr:hypothetical protein [Nostoc sp. ChiQUE01b]MDZ8260112.1 hypothetical protein [Nostoc sp. ChiQUE01b]
MTNDKGQPSPEGDAARTLVNVQFSLPNSLLTAIALLLPLLLN